MAFSQPEYHYDGKKFEVTKEIQEEYDKKGYIIIRNLFSSSEIQRLRNFLDERDFWKMRYYNDDGGGEKIGMILWNHPGNDLTGWMSRCNRMVDTAEQLLGGEVYHYHTKMVLKEAQTGGAFHWHQDYGYWYENGCMFPDMITVTTALDKADKENGCLQVLPGSHKMGRLNHISTKSQVMLEKERLEWAKKIFPLVHLELNSGDAAFFHCNLLHTSAQNRSDRNRYAFLVAYNKASNNPMLKKTHPQYTKLDKVPDSMILEGESGEVDWEGKDFNLPGFKLHALEQIKEREHGRTDQN